MSDHAQTRPMGQSNATDRTDPYGSAERITVAMTTDQLEDAKLGRALRELPPEWEVSWHDREGDGPVTWRVRVPSIQRNRKVGTGPTLLAAINAAMRDKR